MHHLTILALALGHHARHARHLHHYATSGFYGPAGIHAWTVVTLLVLFVGIPYLVISHVAGRRRKAG